MGHGHAASGHQQVVNMTRDQDAVRDLIAETLLGMPGRVVHARAIEVVDVDEERAVADGIVTGALRLHILFGQDHLAQDAPAFT